MLRQRISGFGVKLIAGVNSLVGKHTNDAGLVVLTTPYLNFTSAPFPFINPENGIAMNVNGAFSGFPEQIHDGTDTLLADSGTTDGTTTSKLVDSAQNFDVTVGVGMTVKNTTDTTYAVVTAVDSATTLSLSADIMVSGEAYQIGNYWTGSNVIGTKGTFNSTDAARYSNATKSIKWDNGNLGDIIQFLKETPKDLSDNTALTFNVNIDKDWGLGDNLIVYGYDTSGGAMVGNSVDIRDYIDSGNFDTNQGAVIPIADLGLTGATTVDALRLEIETKDGKAPKVYFDEFHFEAAGTPVEYTVTAAPGERVHIQKIRFVVAANIGAADIAWDSFMGTTMANGLNVIRRVDGITQFSGTVRTLSDCYNVGFVKDHEPDTDGTDTVLVMSVNFPENQIMYGNPDDNFIRFTVNDDLTGLLRFTAAVQASVEI